MDFWGRYYSVLYLDLNNLKKNSKNYSINLYIYLPKFLLSLRAPQAICEIKKIL